MDWVTAAVVVATVAADDLVKAQSALTTRLHLTTVMMMDDG